jgi:Peptidase A4 family
MGKKSLLTYASLIAALSVSASAVAQGPPRTTPPMIATNRPDVQAYPLPPPGFQPLTATAQQLQYYGFPPRPSSEAPKAMALWHRMAAGLHHRIIPEFGTSDRYHMPVQDLQWSTAAETPGSQNAPQDAVSTNWSGQALVQNTVPLVLALGLWNVPSVLPPQGANCSGSAEQGWFSADWVGLDGADSRSQDLVQAGTEGDVFCANGQVSFDYHPWWEWLPHPETPIINFFILPGDAFMTQVVALDATHAQFVMIDLTSGAGVSFQVSAPAGAQVVGTSAEWIHEATTVNGHVSVLPHYGALSFTAMDAEDTTQQTYTPGTPKNAMNLSITLVDASDIPVSIPHLLGDDTQWVFSASGNQTLFGQ